MSLLDEHANEGRWPEDTQPQPRKCPDCKQELTGDDMIDREVHGRCSEPPKDAETKLLSKINKAIRDKDATAFLAAIESSRSKPQKWTPEYLDELLDLKFERGPVAMSVPDYYVRLQSVADNINAALKAEPEWPDVIGSGGKAPSEPRKEERGGAQELVSNALDNAITALGQCQKGTARQFLESAVNASLATERKQAKSWEQVAIKEEKVARKAERSLADERELREQENDGAVKIITALNAKLLAAQAAIANVKTELEALQYHVNNNQREFAKAGIKSTLRKLESVDLSALEQHDAEVRKPLVEALEKISTGRWPPESAAIAKAALSTVKETPNV